MCLCNGTGGIQTVHGWGIQFDPCPDSNCEFDREKSRKEYEAWREQYFKACEMTNRR